MLPLGALGAILLGPWPGRLVRLLWFIPLLLIYMSYYWFSPRPMAYRFLLVLLPAFVGCAYACIDHMHANRWARYAAMLLLAFLTFFHDESSLRIAWQGRTHINCTPNLIAGNFLAARLQPTALVFTEDRLAHHLSERQHFELYDLAAFSRSEFRRFPAPRIYTIQEAIAGRIPPRMQPARIEFFNAFYKTQTDRTLQQAKRQLIEQALAHHQQVAFLLPNRTISSEESSLPPRCTFQSLGTINVAWSDPASDRPGYKETWELFELQAPPLQTQDNSTKPVPPVP
jgi:hypothetical protein